MAGSNTKPMLVGFDLGTNTSCIRARFIDSDQTFFNGIIPTVVGYINDGIVENILPDNAKVMFGDEALKNRLHLNLVWPLQDGIIEDLKAAKDYAGYIRECLNVNEGQEVSAVIGVPANATDESHQLVLEAMTGTFDRVVLVPEPFLAALGFRDEKKLKDADYVDPVSNSLFVDIGAGTTDISLVQGYHPTADDQISMPFAGDAVDEILAGLIKKTYPYSALTKIKVREIKEQNSYVGEYKDAIKVKVMVGGKPRMIDVKEHISTACEALLTKVYDGVCQMIAKADPDSVNELMKNIIITGGGSCIRSFAIELQNRLIADGFDEPVVRVVGEQYKEFVGIGALKAAAQTSEDKWQYLFA